MEDSIEMFFSDIKRHTRGTPALKDLVYGIHLKHLEELRTEHKSKKDPRFATPVAPERANEMSKLCLRYALVLVGFASPAARGKTSTASSGIGGRVRADAFSV